MEEILLNSDRGIVWDRGRSKEVTRAFLTNENGVRFLNRAGREVGICEVKCYVGQAK